MLKRNSTMNFPLNCCNLSMAFWPQGPGLKRDQNTPSPLSSPSFTPLSPLPLIFSSLPPLFLLSHLSLPLLSPPLPSLSLTPLSPLPLISSSFPLLFLLSHLSLLHSSLSLTPLSPLPLISSSFPPLFLPSHLSLPISSPSHLPLSPLIFLITISVHLKSCF